MDIADAVNPVGNRIPFFRRDHSRRAGRAIRPKSNDRFVEMERVVAREGERRAQNQKSEHQGDYIPERKSLTAVAALVDQGLSRKTLRVVNVLNSGVAPAESPIIVLFEPKIALRRFKQFERLVQTTGTIPGRVGRGMVVEVLVIVDRCALDFSDRSVDPVGRLLLIHPNVVLLGTIDKIARVPEIGQGAQVMGVTTGRFSRYRRRYEREQGKCGENLFQIYSLHPYLNSTVLISTNHVP